MRSRRILASNQGRSLAQPNDLSYQQLHANIRRHEMRYD